MRVDQKTAPSEQIPGHTGTLFDSTCSRYQELNGIKPRQKHAQPNPIIVKIKTVWGLLTDDEIALYITNREQFFAKLQEKYGLSHEQAEAQIRMIEASCGSSSKVVLPAA